MPFDDGWNGEIPPPPRPTIVTYDQARSAVTENDSPDIPFERSINPYKGCEHGCVYCFARPTHAYLGFSPGLDFETRIVARRGLAAALKREISRPGYTPKPIALGANTDPYQPVERELGITREVLEVLAAHAHPVTVVTKSALVLRDLDVLGPMAADGLAHVHVSLTTLDGKLARRLEPRAAAPARRLATVAALGAEGVPCGVLTSPMIPGLNDHELEALLEAAAKAGASSAGYILLRLPRELAELFDEWLTRHVPEKKSRILRLLRDAHGGALYRSEFGRRMRGRGPYADLLARRFDAAAARLGLSRRRPPLDVSLFRHDPAERGQLELFRADAPSRRPHRAN